MPDEIVLTLPRLDPERVGAALAKQAAAFVREPENLAGFSGELLLPLIVFRGCRPPLVPFLAVALMGYAGGRMAWRSYKNLEVIAQAARDDA